VIASSSATAADGTRLSYFEGAGSGRPLLLLAGQANNHHWWDIVLPHLQPWHQTITLDYRGTGLSAGPLDGYSTEGFANDAVAVLDELGLGEVDVYGTSMGGRVAQWIAINHRSRVRRLVLGCTSPGGPNAVERDRSVRLALADPDPAAARTALLSFMYSPEWLRTHAGPYSVLGDTQMPRHARLGHLRASNRHDAWDRLPSICAPTLILHGTEDQLTPVINAELLVQRLPDARAHLIPGARHAYFNEYVERASSIVVDFLNADDAGTR
jgi:pimeloyl-ACP methyl ester carboxylesterase